MITGCTRITWRMDVRIVFWGLRTIQDSARAAGRRKCQESEIWAPVTGGRINFCFDTWSDIYRAGPLPKVNTLPVCMGANLAPGHVGRVARRGGQGSSAQQAGSSGTPPVGGFTPGAINSLPLTHHLLLSTLLSAHVSRKHLGLCPGGLDILTEEAHHRSL